MKIIIDEYRYVDKSGIAGTEEEPAFNIETEYLQPYYIEQEDKITQKWEVKELEEVDG